MPVRAVFDYAQTCRRTPVLHAYTSHHEQSSVQTKEGSDAPLMVRAARGERLERPPCWMMRQAGRYQASYRQLAERVPSFRQRSETTDLIVEISLQPWEAFRPDGIIIFSDILTPLPGMGINFEIDDKVGPVIENPVRDAAQLSALHPINLERLRFTGNALRMLRTSLPPEAAVLGFVGCPWTLATYVVEGGSSTTYKTIKTMRYSAPALLAKLLDHLADQIAEYAIYQASSGADYVMLFDSWAAQLPPKDWLIWSKPYIERLVRRFKAAHPRVPLCLYCFGAGGLLEYLPSTGVDVIGVDWTLDMADARRRLGKHVPVQGNVDPSVLFGPPGAIEDAVNDCITKAGASGHILNLGHGVMVGTPEESVKAMFDLSKRPVW